MKAQLEQCQQIFLANWKISQFKFSSSNSNKFRRAFFLSHDVYSLKMVREREETHTIELIIRNKNTWIHLKETTTMKRISRIYTLHTHTETQTHDDS